MSNDWRKTIVLSTDAFQNHSGGPHSANFDEKVHKPQSKSYASGTLYTVKSRAVDRSTIQFWDFLAKGHST